MENAPCGCELIDKANKCLDEDEKTSLLEMAQAAKDSWHCFCDTPNNFPENKDCLSVEQKRTIKIVCNLIEAPEESFNSCPVAYLKQQWIQRMCYLYRWFDKGQLSLVEPNPSKVIVDALSVIDSAKNLRLRLEAEKREKEHQEQMKNNSHNYQHNE